MSRRARLVPRILAALAAAAVLAACAGSLFRSKEPPHAVYLLSITPVAGAKHPVIPVDVTVLRPRVRPGLDSDLIAALYADRRLDHFAGARWSGPLDEMMQDLTVRAFRFDAHAMNVHTDDSAFGTGDWLEMYVADFQAEYAGGEDSGPPTVHVRLVARIGTSRDRRVLGQAEADVRQSASDNRLTAIIEAYDRAVDAALERIVAQAAPLLGGS